MEAQTALQLFLEGSLAKRRERYIGFIKRPKAQHKFLEAIYHTLEDDFDYSKSTKRFPSITEPIPGYWFAPPDEFGIPISDIKEFWDSHEDSFLVVSKDGKLGIHSPETFIDSRTIYRI